MPVDVEEDNLKKFENAGAWFKLIFGSIYALFAFFTLIVFFRARDVFEIRARSAYLVTFLGLVLLINQGLNVELHAIVLFQVPAKYYQNNIAVFFYTFTIACCYISRVIRLAVAYSPKFRRALPWLMSEQLLIMGSLSMGLLSISIPVYYRYTITGPNADARFIAVQTENIWTCTVALQVLQAAMLPVVWMIDDLFHISRELIVIIVLGLIQSVINKLYQENVLGDEVGAWINPPNMGFFTSCILFGLSIIDPVRRLVFHPMARKSPTIVRSHTRSKRSGSMCNVNQTAEGKFQREPFAGIKSFAQVIPGAVEEISAHEIWPSEDLFQPGRYSHPASMWNYEKIAGSPEIADAFRTFANRALCQESVLFLEEVARYYKEDYEIGAGTGGGQVAAFESIVRRFIMDGAPDEINIGCKDKNAIMRLFNTSADTFDRLDEEDLRTVFDQAYAEIRYMLESNILSKFIDTDEFRRLANAARPRVRRRRFCYP